MTSEIVQRYVRVALYALFSSLATIGFTVPENKMTAIAGAVGFVANLVYTIWGTQLSALLSEAEKKAGVRKIEVTVDRSQIDAGTLNAATPAAVIVKPEGVAP